VNHLTPYGSATSPDSLEYLDIANNIKNGKGFLATDFSLENAGTNSLIKKRSWPPLYAYLLSFFINTASDVSSVSDVSKILLAISIIFVFLIIYRNIGSSAIIPSLLLCFTIPIITIYTYTWSETLFLPILIVLIWASIEYLEIDSKSIFYRIIILSILLTTMILLAYTRYIGIAFVVLLPIVYLFTNRGTLDRLLFSTSFLIYTVTVGYLLYGNYVTTGNISGAVRLPSDKTILENMIDIYYAFIAIFPTSISSIILVLIISVSIVFFIKTCGGYPINAANKNSRHRVFILITVIAVYLISIIALRSYSQFDMLDIRLLSPTFIAIYMLIAILPSFFDVNSKRGISVYIVSLLLIVSLSINGYKEWLEASNNWKEAGTPKHRLNNKIIYNNFTMNPYNNSKIKLLSNLIQGDGFIVVDRPLIWEFITGAKCLRKPKNINSDNFIKINSLPEGSLLLLDKHEINQIISRHGGQNVNYKYINLGNLIAIQLPLKTSTL